MSDPVQALKRGELVLLPTDTVWGLGVRADHPEAVARLYSLKGRETQKPLVRLIGEWLSDDADLLSLSPRARRVVKALWPGALTVVCPTGRSLRWPRHEELCRWLQGLDFALAVTSANLSGQPAPLRLEDVVPQIRQGVAAVLPGEAGGQPASTVVRFDVGEPEILRAGPIDAETLGELWRPRIAFVCTGNTCRSPMAEFLARQAFPAGIFFSAGLMACEGSLASPEALKVCADMNLDLSTHRSQPIEALDWSNMDFAYGLTRSHVERLRASGVAAELLDSQGRDLPDPFGASSETYRLCRDAIREAITRRQGEWEGLNKTF